MAATRTREMIVDEIPAGGRFGAFASRPPAEHLVLGICDLGTALGFVVASTHDHPCDTGPIAVLEHDRLATMTAATSRWLREHPTTEAGARYRVFADGSSGLSALVRDVCAHTTVLALRGLDRFVLAEAIAAVLNTARSEMPVELR